MPKQKITQEQLDRLIEDATYLQDEAEALKYVIDEVPYTEAPPEGRSISAMLLFIDFAQMNYYRPILKKAIEDPRPTHIETFGDFEDSFETDEEKLQDIQKILSKLSKHRAWVVNTIKSISIIDWETIVYKDDQQILLFDFMHEMVHFDRSQLKKVADLVMLYKNEKHNQREIKRKKAQSNNSPDNS